MALLKYYIPRDLECAIKEHDENAVSLGSNYLGNKFIPVLKALKNIDCLEIARCHYLQLLKLGLYLEEYQQRKDMNKFEMHGSTIKKVPDSQKKFKIDITGLDEDNSDLSISDSLKVYKRSDPDTVFFLKVTKICNGHVIVTADNRFCKNHTDSTEYSLVLIFNTYTFQCCHYALSVITSPMISNYFFPKKSAATIQKINCNLNWFNRDVENNPEQKQAVYNILNKSALPAPYILYGPPGTGKTSTLVEVVCQIWKQQPRSYILICAPSNAACDVVAKKLLDYIPKNLYRIYSQSQDYSSIDGSIKNCCNFDKDGSVDDLEKVDFTCKNIIITTICTSLRLEKLGLTFSHVFIDEASQATLPEAFLPLCAMKYSPNVQVVLSGDHQQLGPGIRSKLAEPLLGQSILDKLMKRKAYRKDEKKEYDSRYITKLIRNFRSSKDIIHVPNVLFYDNELIACSKTKVNTFPVVFHAVEGKERKTDKSKSSYNMDEINEVLHLVNNFIHKKIGNKTICQKDIGIVTPFSLQASQIKKRLYSTGLRGVDVGTVEIYQGQEKEVIIVTTVRSKTFIHNGVEHIGFLSNAKRFNVALTRAKSFLMVVGSPSVLETNKNWRYFLRFCQENNACKGNSFVIKNELAYSMQDMSVGIKTIKSTDLFEKTLKILKTDDGRSMGNRKNNIKHSTKTDSRAIVSRNETAPLSNPCNYTRSETAPLSNTCNYTRSETAPLSNTCNYTRSKTAPLSNTCNYTRSETAPLSNTCNYTRSDYRPSVPLSNTCNYTRSDYRTSVPLSNKCNYTLSDSRPSVATRNVGRREVEVTSLKRHLCNIL